MLTEVVRKSMEQISNRFELVVIASERCRQLLLGARPTAENPTRERLMKLAMREIVAGRIVREDDHWKVDRLPVPDIFTPPPSNAREDFLDLTRDEEE